MMEMMVEECEVELPLEREAYNYEGRAEEGHRETLHRAEKYY